MIIDWEFWLSLITAAVAVVALLQTRWQIKLNNKQYLFDTRVKHYLIAKELIRSYEATEYWLMEIHKTPEIMDIAFLGLANNPYLREIMRVVLPDVSNEVWDTFRPKMEELQTVATKIKFIFVGREGVLLENFLLRYEDVLSAIHNCNKKDKCENDNNVDWIYIEKDVMRLQQAYNLLKTENVEEQIEKQIKLK